MHSLQMKTVGLSFKAGISFLGPAIIFRTSARALLQNEQRGACSSGVLIRVLIISLLSPVLFAASVKLKSAGFSAKAVSVTIQQNTSAFPTPDIF